MKLPQAKELMKTNLGYRVEFEEQRNGVLYSDHFPSNEEAGITTEAEAWSLAEGFAKAGEHKGIVNVYVIYAHDYRPVEGYREQILNKYPMGS